MAQTEINYRTAPFHGSEEIPVPDSTPFWRAPQGKISLKNTLSFVGRSLLADLHDELESGGEIQFKNACFDRWLDWAPGDAPIGCTGGAGNPPFREWRVKPKPVACLPATGKPTGVLVQWSFKKGVAHPNKAYRLRLASAPLPDDEVAIGKLFVMNAPPGYVA